MDRICLNAIYEFCDGTPTTRNMVEGENILNSGHLIHCGCTLKNQELLNIFSMCLQTSALREKPHEIQGVFNFKNNENWVISEMKCTCKAGESQNCKHCVARLLYLNRTGINALEAISQTDLQCTWNQHKPALQLYAPKPLKEHTF